MREMRGECLITSNLLWSGQRAEVESAPLFAHARLRRITPRRTAARAACAGLAASQAWRRGAGGEGSGEGRRGGRWEGRAPNQQSTCRSAKQLRGKSALRADGAEIICGWTRACVSSEEGLGGRAEEGQRRAVTHLASAEARRPRHHHPPSCRCPPAPWQVRRRWADGAEHRWPCAHRARPAAAAATAAGGADGAAGVLGSPLLPLVVVKRVDSTLRSIHPRRTAIEFPQTKTCPVLCSLFQNT